MYTIHLCGGSMNGKVVEQEHCGQCFLAKVLCDDNPFGYRTEIYEYLHFDRTTNELWAWFRGLRK